jgi:hypothetical protein
VACTAQEIPGLGHNCLSVGIFWFHIAGECHQQAEVRLPIEQFPREDWAG